MKWGFLENREALSLSKKYLSQAAEKGTDARNSHCD